MPLNLFTATRVFQSPYLRRTETLSGWRAILGALLSGPFYYWKKQAPVEAAVLFTAELVLFFISNHAISNNAIDGTTPSVILWLASAFAAPVLLPMCYRRKGWVEIVAI